MEQWKWGDYLWKNEGKIFGRLKISIISKLNLHLNLHKRNLACGFSVKVAEISCLSVSLEKIKARLNYQAYHKYDELNLHLHA